MANKIIKTDKITIPVIQIYELDELVRRIKVAMNETLKLSNFIDYSNHNTIYLLAILIELKLHDKYTSYSLQVIEKLHELFRISLLINLLEKQKLSLQRDCCRKGTYGQKMGINYFHKSYLYKNKVKEYEAIEHSIKSYQTTYNDYKKEIIELTENILGELK